jgi:hypothetical protein
MRGVTAVSHSPHNQTENELQPFQFQGTITEYEAAANAQELLPPPQAEIRILHDLAMKGAIRRLRHQMDHIEQLDPQFKPFTQKLRQFIVSYDEDKILAMIEKYLASDDFTD